MLNDHVPVLLDQIQQGTNISTPNIIQGAAKAMNRGWFSLNNWQTFDPQMRAFQQEKAAAKRDAKLQRREEEEANNDDEAPW